MNHPLLTRLTATPASPLLIGMLTFATTVAMILAQPGSIA